MADTKDNSDRKSVGKIKTSEDEKNKNKDFIIFERLLSLLFNNMYPEGLEFHYSGKSFPQFDIDAKGRDININLHNLEFEHLLKLWKIKVTYKGKGVIEMGRGIKGVKINYPRLFFAVVSHKLQRLFRTLLYKNKSKEKRESCT